MRELKKRRTKTKAVITLATYIGFLFNARWQQGSSKRNLSLAPSAMQNNLLLCLFKVSEIVLAWIERHNRRVLDYFVPHLYIYFTAIVLCTIASNMSTYSIERGLPLNDSLCWSCSLGYHSFRKYFSLISNWPYVENYYSDWVFPENLIQYVPFGWNSHDKKLCIDNIDNIDTVETRDCSCRN